MLTDVSPTPVATGTDDVQGLEPQAGLRLMGYSVRESAGSPDVATLNLRHGTTGSDPVMVAVNLAASAGDAKWFGPQGLAADGGIFVERLTGETTITLLTAIG